MLQIGILGINFKTAHLKLREAIARGARSLSGERAIFFRHPVVLLSTCNRTEIYFSSDDLAGAHNDLLAHLRLHIEEPFEQNLYSYFGNDCFAHLCKVTAGLDSAILAETEIQRQVKVAYGGARRLPSCMHFLFQKALKVGKNVRNEIELERGAPSLYGTIWQLVESFERVLLVGYSEINRGFLSFFSHKGVRDISLCTQYPSKVNVEGVRVYDREVLSRWGDFDLIICASKAEDYLIRGKGSEKTLIFDLSVPRNVDPNVNARVFNIEQIHQMIEQKTERIDYLENLIWENVIKLSQIYYLKTQHVLESAGMGSHL